MKTLARCCVRAAALAVVFAALNAISASAQEDDNAQGFDFSLTVGSGQYESDALCLNTNAAFPVIELSGGHDLFAVAVARSNGAHPWTDPPTAVEEAFLTNGDAVRIMAETFPIALLSRLPGRREGALGDINRYVRPFVGAGVYISGDGDTAPAGTAGRELPTFGLEGSTSLILSYGARVYLPGRDRLLRLVLLYRGNTMFLSDVVYRTPDNGTLRGNGKTLTWGEWGVGVSLRIGG